MSVTSCLITGGCGFVGASLALRLRDAFPGLRVTALDNFHRTGSRLNVPRLAAAGVSVVEGDVRRRTVWESLQPADLIIDAAAEPSVLAGSGGVGADYVVETNLGGTLNLLEWARTRGGRLLFLSSSRVYPVDALRAIRLRTESDRFAIEDAQTLPGVTPRGIGPGFPMDGPRTLYGATKFASEVMVREYAAQFGLDAAINRCGVIAGPWQMGKVDQGVAALWVARHLFGRPLCYIGYGGRQVRDFLHIADLGDLIVLQAGRAARFAGEVFPAGGGPERSVSLRELTRLCQDATGCRVPVTEDAAVREGDVPLFVTDNTETTRALGWSPKRSVAEVAGDLARWVGENRAILQPVFGA